MESSMPLSEYANKLIGVDSALIEGKLTLRTRQPDCLPSVESIDLLFYLVLETSFYVQQQFKAVVLNWGGTAPQGAFWGPRGALSVRLGIVGR